MKNLLKVLVPVIAIALVGCATTSEKKGCCKKDKSCKTAPLSTGKDDSKEIHKSH